MTGLCRYGPHSVERHSTPLRRVQNSGANLDIRRHGDRLGIEALTAHRRPPRAQSPACCYASPRTYHRDCWPSSPPEMNTPPPWYRDPRQTRPALAPMVKLAAISLPMPGLDRLDNATAPPTAGARVPPLAGNSRQRSRADSARGDHSSISPMADASVQQGEPAELTDNQ